MKEYYIVVCPIYPIEHNRVFGFTNKNRSIKYKSSMDGSWWINLKPLSDYKNTEGKTITPAFISSFRLDEVVNITNVEYKIYLLFTKVPEKDKPYVHRIYKRYR